MIRILVPLDGAHEGERALEHLSRRFARGGGAQLTLLYVHEPPIRSRMVAAYQRPAALAAQRAARAQEVLGAAARRLGALGLAVETRVAEGPLYPTIVREAERVHASEVVLGVRPPALGRLGLRLARGIRGILEGPPSQVTIVP